MREIKFRVWHQGRFQEDVQVRFYTDQTGWEYGHPDAGGDLHISYEEKDGAILTQWTEIKDKNGVEIYEGDIVEFEFGIAEVVYGSDAGFELKSDEGTFYPIYPNKENLEVIGNIYEHPEKMELKGI